AAPEPYLQTVLFTKVVLALMLGRAADRYLDTQRAAHLRRMHELTELKRVGSLTDTLLADHGLFHLEADLHWIATTTARVGELAEMVRTDELPDTGARGGQVVRPDAGAARGRPRGGRGRLPRGHGPERVGQVDAAALPGRHLHARRGRDRLRRAAPRPDER